MKNTIKNSNTQKVIIKNIVNLKHTFSLGVSMKILGVFPFYTPFLGGAERVYSSLMSGMQTFDFDTIVYTSDVIQLSPYKRTINRKEKSNGITINRFFDFGGPIGFSILSWFVNLLSERNQSLPYLECMKYLRSIIGYPFMPQLFLKMIKTRKNYDVIITGQVLWTTAHTSYCFSKIYGKPLFVIPNFHIGHVIFEHYSTIDLLCNSDVILVYSDWELKELTKRGIPVSKIRVMGPLYKPVNESVVKADSQISKLKGEKFLFLGRREYDKGYYHFIDSLNICNDPNIYGIIAGPPSPIKQTEQQKLITEYKKKVLKDSQRIKERILDLGTLSEERKLSVIKSCDAIVLPSRVESFGLVLLEAFNFKKPVIVCDIGPLPEVARDSGICVSWDNPTELASEIERIASNKEMRNKLGYNGYTKLKQFDISKGLHVVNRALNEVVV